MANYKVNRENLPASDIKVFWSGTVGSDTDITNSGNEGQCPREIRVANTGTLVLQKIDGTQITLSAGHLTLPLPICNIAKIIASGSTAFGILCLY
jgi:hypothetical protein